MKRSLVYSTIAAGSAGLLLILSVLVSRMLGQDGWGNFAYVVSLGMIGEALMDFGIHQVTIRSIARDRSTAAPLFRNSLALKALPGAAMFLVMTAIALGLHGETDLRLASVLMLGSAVLRSYLLTVRGVLQGLEQFGDDSLIVVGDRLIVLIFCSVALWRGHGLVGLSVAFLAARGVAVAGALAIAHRHVGLPKPAFDTVVWRELQRRAMPLGAFLVVLNLYSYIDTIILRSLVTPFETGLYNSAYKIYEGLTYATAILSAVVTPRLSHLWSVDRRAHHRLVRTTLGASAALALALTTVTWFAAPIALRMFGADAVAAVPTLRILGLGLIFVFVIWILHAVAISVFEERWLLRTALIGSLANIALNFLLIPGYGRDGAAVATVLGEVLSMAILFWGLRRAIWPRQAPA